jgi:hypothetical protein
MDGLATMTRAAWTITTDMCTRPPITYMGIYELDPVGADEFVAIGAWPNRSVVLSCPFGSNYCEGESAWANQTNVNPNVLSAKIKLRVELETMRR